MLKDDVYFATAETLAPDLRAGRLSPVELTQGFLDRIARWNDRYNAFERPTPELALEQARRAASDLRANNWHGPLHGVPYAAKDLFDTKGVVTAWGTRFLRDRVPDENATVVDRLEQAGAVLLGKTAMVEFAGCLGYRFANASASGPGRNPWDPSRWTGGSASGPGAGGGRGLGRGRGRGSRHVRARDRDVGLDPLPERLLRAHGNPPHLRPRLARRRHGRRLHVRQGRTARALGRGLPHRPRGDRRRRPARPLVRHRAPASRARAGPHAPLAQGGARAARLVEGRRARGPRGVRRRRGRAARRGAKARDRGAAGRGGGGPGPLIRVGARGAWGPFLNEGRVRQLVNDTARGSARSPSPSPGRT